MNKILFSLIFFFSFFVTAKASILSFDISTTSIYLHDEFKVDFVINTEKKTINAIEGKISFDKNYLELKEIRSGNSVVNFWIEKPIEKNGNVSFAGITPGGYISDKSFVFSLVFKAKKDGDTILKVYDAKTLENDGLGTESKLTLKNKIISIDKSSDDTRFVEEKIVDNDKPEIFKPEIGQDESIFDNKWFVVFETQDKGSGIARYEVKESKYFLFTGSKWQEATSPYVLSDQNLESFVYVKAIDNNGNERIIKMTPQNHISWYANFEIWIIIILVIVALYAIRKVSWKKQLKK